MDWINDVQKAVNYMEEHLLEPISIEQIAGYIHSSSEQFQKMFHIITGFTPSEYLLRQNQEKEDPHHEL